MATAPCFVDQNNPSSPSMVVAPPPRPLLVPDPVGSASSAVVPMGSGGVRLQRRRPHGIRLPPPPRWLPPCCAGKQRRAARPRPHHTNEHSSLNLRQWIQAPPVRSRPKYPCRRRQVRARWIDLEVPMGLLSQLHRPSPRPTASMASRASADA
ncbi:uncharacterized protein LOC119321874 isoform X2 [Triticum dicoccoides]|uniref:uncharacterized protein LOC119321874 isoform X2 n=1 Tax=Triticum dicoccoides TaxID=85692 RepID=UPI001891C4FA|nr:uncharacterized protein LOC119321874 isoform X2 [Triticum dicoccoides]XP_044409527.1 uncharacterized protein LOC123134321 isoform X2 [Triticum aestivum]